MAAWTFLSISQAILGLKPTLGGLKIDPCIPSDWKGYSVSRRYRGALYRITVENPNGVEHGIEKILVNGKEVESNVLQTAEAGSMVEVKVTLG